MNALTRPARPDELCDACSRTPWEDVLRPPLYTLSIVFSTPSISPERLDCRICCLCLGIVNAHNIADDVIKVAWHGNIPNTGTDIESNDTLDREARRESHLLATHINVGVTSLGLDTLYPPDIDFREIKAWLRNCRTQHSTTCRLAPRIRLRHLTVIDCKRMVVTALPEGEEFVALSYVWGSSTTTPRAASPTLPNELPATLEDSVSATLTLGYRYLWIDRYYIDQSNEDEKKEQILQMSTIYATAQLTLVAVAGEDPGHSLPGV